MATFDESILGDFDELPCEFCDELYPMDLLIEHQSGCRPDLVHFNLQDVTPPSSIKTAAVIEPLKIVQSEGQKSNDDGFIDAEETTKSKPVIDKSTSEKDLSAKGGIKQKTDKVQPKDLTKCDFEPVMTFEDNLLQESGTKLMAYGSSMDKNKRTEEEKPSFKIPSLPLLNNADQKVEDSYLSEDSDDGESLEDFWRRAEIKLSQRLCQKVTI